MKQKKKVKEEQENEKKEESEDEEEDEAAEFLSQIIQSSPSGVFFVVLGVYLWHKFVAPGEAPLEGGSPLAGDLSDVYGNVPRESIKRLGQMLVPPLSEEDEYLEIGSGEGEIVIGLGAHLKSAVGVEINPARHENACRALGVDPEPTCAKGRTKLILDDFRNLPRLFKSGNLVWFHSISFAHSTMRDLVAHAAKEAPPGQVLVTMRPLPGCHLGLVYVQKSAVETSWGQQVEVYFYVRAPQLHPTGPLPISETAILTYRSMLEDAFIAAFNSVRDLAMNRYNGNFADAAIASWNLSGGPTSMYNRRLGALLGSGSQNNRSFARLFSAEASLNGNMEVLGECVVKEVVAHIADRAVATEGVPKTFIIEAALKDVWKSFDAGGIGFREDFDGIANLIRIWAVSMPKELQEEIPADAWLRVQQLWEAVETTLRSQLSGTEDALTAQAEAAIGVLGRRDATRESNSETVEGDLIWLLMKGEI